MTIPGKIVNLKNEGFIPLKIHKNKILTVKCMICGQEMSYRCRKEHFCTGSEKKH